MPSETALVQRESNEKQWCGKKNKKNKKQNKNKNKNKNETNKIHTHRPNFQYLTMYNH